MTIEIVLSDAQQNDPQWIALLAQSRQGGPVAMAKFHQVMLDNLFFPEVRTFCRAVPN